MATSESNYVRQSIRTAATVSADARLEFNIDMLNNSDPVEAMVIHIMGITGASSGDTYELKYWAMDVDIQGGYSEQDHLRYVDKSRADIQNNIFTAGLDSTVSGTNNTGQAVLNVADGTVFQADDTIIIDYASTQYFYEIVSISTNALTLSRNLDVTHTNGSTVHVWQHYSFAPPPLPRFGGKMIITEKSSNAGYLEIVGPSVQGANVG